MPDRDLLELKLADGSSIYVETADDPRASQGPQRVARGDSGARQADSRFEDAVARLRPAAQALLDTLKGLEAPDAVRLEFGVKFNARAGAVLASVDSEAVFKVVLDWKRPGASDA